MATIKGTKEQERLLTSRRNKRANSLDIFRPTPQQEPFFLAMEKDFVLEMLLGGGNRAGKSLCAVVAMTSLLLNQPVTFKDGSKHHMRPPRWRNDSIKAWIVGHNWTHIGQAVHRMLLLPGMFKMVRDPKTLQWRAWDPTMPGEVDFDKAHKSPPFIRAEDIVDGEAGISWENKKDNQVKSFDLAHDGTRVEFYASTGERPQGSPANIIWVDEKIDDGKWYGELLVRLIDDRGRIMWTAWPDTAPSAEMEAIKERALEQLTNPKKWKTHHIILDGSENPFTAGDHREGVMATMDDDERSARDRGIMNNDRWRMYPRFSKYIHCAYGNDPTKDDKLASTLRQSSGLIPANWTRYLILDPGTQHPFVLFVAVPPPEFGDFIVPYDELAAPDWAEPLAKKVAAKLGITRDHPGDTIEEMIADFHACRQTPLGFNGTVGQNYEKYFREQKIKSRRHGTRFTPGSDEPTVRIMEVQGTMSLRHDGFPRLRILGCPVLVGQLGRAQWDKDAKGNPTDKPAPRQVVDGASCLEYFVSRKDCGYFAPPPIEHADKNTFELVSKGIANQLGIVKPNFNSGSVLCGPAESIS